jgi:hypothetical protein
MNKLIVSADLLLGIEIFPHFLAIINENKFCTVPKIPNKYSQKLNCVCGLVPNVYINVSVLTSTSKLYGTLVLPYVHSTVHTRIASGRWLINLSGIIIHARNYRPSFRNNKPKKLVENERFELVFVKTGSIN